MLKKIEFYGAPDGRLYVKEEENPPYEYNQGCTDITSYMASLIADLYPSAYTSLQSLYAKSEINKDFFQYKIVHRFIRCNFGEYDTLSLDIAYDGCLNFEEVHCPLRGECEFEGVICRPKIISALSEREGEVARLVGCGLSRQEIADELNISIYTVHRHIANIKSKLHFKKTQQIIVEFNGFN